VVDAVAYIHARGIVHRDLKSNNVRIDESGRVKLLDFGIAKSGDSPRLTTDGSVIGTLHYLSPEQVTGGPATAASDTWALGVMLYEMVTGVVPFASESLTGVMARILKGAYDPPERGGEAVPAAITRIIAKCLMVEPAQRYASTRALLDHVRELATTAGPAAPGPAPRVLPGAVAFTRHRWPLLASIGAATAAIGYFAWSTVCCAPPAGGDRLRDSLLAAESAAAPATATVPPPPRRVPAAPQVERPAVTATGELRPVTIKVFGDVAAEVWRDGRRLGVTPTTFQAPIGAWVRLTLRHAGREQVIPAFQVNAVHNEYVYTLAAEPQLPSDHP
jgi:serine/threonine-protein kinase